MVVHDNASNSEITLYLTFLRSKKYTPTRKCVITLFHSHFISKKYFLFYVSLEIYKKYYSLKNYSIMYCDVINNLKKMRYNM